MARIIMRATAPQKRSPLAFFLLLFALGIPIMMFAGVQVLPNVPLFTFGAFLPVSAALILRYREEGTTGIVGLLRRSFDWKRIQPRTWYFPILLTWPFIVSIQYGVGVLNGLHVSSPHIPGWMPLIVVLSFVAALGEELGWMGYAFEPMQARLGALGASIALGIIWASIHVPYFVPSGAPSAWIIWQLIYIAATRVVFAWVYDNTRNSVFAIAVMHTLFNSVWFLFPRDTSLTGLSVPSFYTPRSLALTTIGVAALVTFLYGHRTFTQYRYARQAAPV